MIDVKDLAAFLSILDTGSISKAASSLGMTQPALSLKLKKIELELGVQLFQRTARSMVPLDTCRAIAPAAREVLAKLEGVKETLALRISELKGPVRFGCLSGWVDALTIPAIQSLRQLAPEIRLRVKVGQTSELLHEISLGLLDMAVVARPFDTYEGVTCRHLLDEHLVLVAHGLPRANDAQNLKKDLLGMQWVTMTNPDPLVNVYWKETFHEEFPWGDVSQPISVDYILAIRSLVEQIPHTVAVLPSQVVSLGQSSNKNITTHLSIPQKNGLFLVWRENGLELKRFQCVHDLLIRLSHDLKPRLALQASKHEPPQPTLPNQP